MYIHTHAGIYTSTSAFSPQLESSKKNTARHSFGQSARWKVSLRVSYEVYACHEAEQDHKERKACIQQTSSLAFLHCAAQDAPDSTLGPGSSDAPSSLGPQVLSSRASPPKTRFGSSTRDQVG